MRWVRAMLAGALPVAAMVLLFCGFDAPAPRSLDAAVIVTEAPAYDALAGLRGDERFPRGARLLLLKDGHAEPLVEGFAASADANVSFDGTKVLFAGIKDAGDRWAVWELTLADGSVRKVMGGESDVVRPLYLPGNRAVYARHTAHGFQLENASLDGSDAIRLGNLNASAMPADVLADGRILFESGFPLGVGKTPELYLVYSDGSGVESYRCDHGSARWGGRQLASGDVVFTHGAALARFTSPLATEAHIAAPRGEYAGGIAEMASGAWLVSERAGEETQYALKLWKPGEPMLRTLLSRPGQDLVEPVVVAPRNRPHRHPSGLHDWDTANLLALDARESREGRLKTGPRMVRLETQDANGNAMVLGSAPVEADGSFFVKAPGDRPIRFSLLDEKGTVLRQEQGWFWCAKGEQRICVGCHTGPERAAENRVPAVLLRTTTPVDLTGAGKQSVAESSSR